MSFLSTNFKSEKKTALKLINKYADSYNAIIQENKFLKSEIRDLNSNLKINKQIIEGFFAKNSPKEKTNNFINKYKIENAKLYEQNLKLNKKIEELTNKLTYKQQVVTETMYQIKEESEKLKTKMFLLEQNNIKKENMIVILKKRLEAIKEDYSYFDQEIYIVDPSKAILQVNDELILYKQIYESLSKMIKDNSESMLRYEQLITDLQIENQNLRNEYKSQIFKTNRERENLICVIQKERSYSGNRKENGLYKNENYRIRNKSKSINKNDNLLGDRKFENEEFLDIIKTVNLTEEEYEKMSKTKIYSKLIETIEMLYTLIGEKNLTLSLVRKENENLNQKNFKLNKENMDLVQENIDLKKEIAKFKSMNNNINNLNKSLSNNTSKISQKTKIKDTMINYEKFIKNEQIEDENETIDKAKIIEDSGNLGENEDSIEHNSIKHRKKKLNASNGKSGLIQSINIIENKENEDFSSINNDKLDKLLLTLASVTSSEFREGCKGIDSFMSTIKREDTEKVKESEKNGNKNNDDDIWNNIYIKEDNK